MPNPGYDPADLAEAVRLVQLHGTVTEASNASGIPRSTLDKRYRTATRDPAIQAAMDATGSTEIPHSFWTKIPPKDGEPGYSVYHKTATDTDMLERIRAAFDGISQATPCAAPASVHADLLTVYLLSDRHTGLMAWARETGEAYNTEIAVQRVREWTARCVDASPSAHTALIIDNGDGQHADDQTNQTPRSKHGLDVDTRHFRTLEADIEALGTAIELAKAKHQRVIVRIMCGNHNPHSWIAISFALAERYRNDDRVEVIRDPSEFFVMDWGKVMIAAHHGDKAKADRLVHFIADEFAEIWGRTRHRFLFTGHLHSHKSQDIGGCTWEQLRAVTARDAYAYSNAYVSRAQMQAITYDRERGEVQRVKVGA
jgi:hypothetical protein